MATVNDWLTQLSTLYTNATATQNAVAVQNAQTNAAVVASQTAAQQAQLQGSIAQVNAAQQVQANANMQNYIKYGVYALLAIGAVFALKKLRVA